MTKLPNVFQNPITKKINNVQDLYRSKENTPNYNSIDINKKINEVFTSLNHVYKSRVKITLNNQEIETDIVGKTNLNLLTLDGKLIKIADIIDIKKV